MAVAKVMKKDTDKVHPLGPLGCRWARWACCTHAGCRAGLWARWAGCRWAWCGTPSLHAAAGSAGGAPVLCNHGIASAPPPLVRRTCPSRSSGSEGPAGLVFPILTWRSFGSVPLSHLTGRLTQLLPFPCPVPFHWCTLPLLRPPLGRSVPSCTCNFLACGGNRGPGLGSKQVEHVGMNG